MMESEVGKLVLVGKGLAYSLPLRSNEYEWWGRDWHTRYRFAQTSTSGGEQKLAYSFPLRSNENEWWVYSSSGFFRRCFFSATIFFSLSLRSLLAFPGLVGRRFFRGVNAFAIRA